MVNPANFIAIKKSNIKKLNMLDTRQKSKPSQLHQSTQWQLPALVKLENAINL
jgi:hypothetical protein